MNAQGEFEELLIELLGKWRAPHIRHEMYPILREIGVEEPEKTVPKILLKMEREGKVMLLTDLYPAFEHPISREQIGRVVATDKLPDLRPYEGYVYEPQKLIEEAEKRKPPPLVGTVRITSEPEGASFEVKGPESFKGKTPFTKKVPPGEYTITWKALKGYAAPKKETLRLEAGEEILFHGEYKEIKKELARRMAKLLEERPALLEKEPEELAPSIIAWAEKDFGVKLPEEEAVEIVEKAFELLEEMKG